MLKKLLSYSVILIILLLLFYTSTTNTKDNEEYISEVTYSFDNTYNETKCKNILIISKIDLYKCMNYNDVNKDIAIIFDDKTIVLAAHSGTGPLAYFKNLYKLKVNDSVLFYHDGLKKEYIVKNISSKLKKDKLEFENIEKQLILITCSYTNLNEQIIYFLLEK